MNRIWRNDVHLDGIPVFWYTNLTDEEIREFYAIIRGTRDDPYEWEVFSIQEGLSPRISTNGLLASNVPFKEGWCLCNGFQFMFNVVYKSALEWEIWEARQQCPQGLRFVNGRIFC